MPKSIKQLSCPACKAIHLGLWSADGVTVVCPITKKTIRLNPDKSYDVQPAKLAAAIKPEVPEETQPDEAEDVIVDEIPEDVLTMPEGSSKKKSTKAKA